MLLCAIIVCNIRSRTAACLVLTRASHDRPAVCSAVLGFRCVQGSYPQTKTLILKPHRVLPWLLKLPIDAAAVVADGTLQETWRTMQDALSSWRLWLTSPGTRLLWSGPGQPR